MLESLAAWVLNTYVGEYVENLNTTQLSIGLLQGEVELENLPLKKDALRKLELPLEVKAGFIGRIKLQIPVRRMRSEPWVISMEKLYLVAGPIKRHQYDEAEDKAAEQARKKAQLKALEDKLRAEHEIASQEAQGSSWWGYGASLGSLATNIVENIQLNVKDVHLRYEDDTMVPGRSFACGVIIKSLAAQSTDGTWIPKFVSRDDTDMMHKLLDLQNFSVYWDVDAALVSHMSGQDLADALQREFFQSSKSSDFKEHDYILEPVTAQAKMKRNTTPLPLRSASTPRLHFDIQLEQMAFNLSEDQYRIMVAMVKEFNRHDKARRFRRWRPSCPIKESYTKWWQFAIEANLHFIREKNWRQSKTYMLERARDNVKYVEAYKQYLLKGSYYMDAQLKSHMEKMEVDLTFEELKILQEVSVGSISKDQALHETKEASTAAAASSTSASPQKGSPKAETPPSASAPPSPPSEAATEDPKQQQGGIFQSWFPGWSGWYGYGGGATQPAADASPSDIAVETASITSFDDYKSMSGSNVDLFGGGMTEMGSPFGSTESLVQTAADTEIEQEIMDVLADSAENNTLLKRDAVFAQLHFCLQSGKFKLCSNESAPGTSSGEGEKTTNGRKTLMELECSIIKMDFESRPRTNGLKFGVSVGGLFLRDMMTEGSILPVLVAPQPKERASGHTARQLFGGMLGSMGKSSLLTPGSAGLFGAAAPAQDLTLFELTYEKKPAHSSADYRLDIKTKPLDIVYNAAAIKRVSEFFSVRKKGAQAEKAEVELATMAKHRYEQLKQQTQDELKHTLDELLEGDEKIKAKRWDFALDISAPQFIIPENFTDASSTLVVFDLGRLQLHNTNQSLKKQDTIEEDEDFVTPSSTPPGETSGEKGENSTTVADIFSQDLSESALHDKIYDKYTLSLSELQVLVGRARDNWKHAHIKGTSHMHVVDKFSITLQLERRLLYTSDPQFPKATLSGTLPSLILHVNEQKIQGLRMVGKLMSPSGDEPSAPSTSAPSEPRTSSPVDETFSRPVNQSLSKSTGHLAASQHARQVMAESRVLLMQFSINQVSLEIQSRERSIAELQVSGVRANFTQQRYHTSVSFTVHSLLVVDALQTFGPDFELLVASHKNLCLDSRSGSIRDSEPGSPLSPLSPKSPASPTELDPAQRGSFHSVQNAVSNALQSLINTTTGMSMDGSWTSNDPPRSPTDPDRRSLYVASPIFDTEALIRMELEIITAPDSNEDEKQKIANIQFNNLDIVANQETIVELLGFFKRVSPKTPTPKKSEQSLQQRLDEAEQQAQLREQQSSGSRLEVTADFHRLNVLLMRAEEKDCGKKVATASLCNAKIQATLVGDLVVEGSLGGLQLLDLTPEGKKNHQKVFSVGMDADAFLFPTAADNIPQMPTSPSSSFSSLKTVTEKALTFTFVRPSLNDGEPPALHRSQIYSPTPPEPICVSVRMASLCYTHTPIFLREISLCLSEFKDYMSSVGSSIKNVATEVAMGLVHKRSEFLASSFYASNLSLDDPMIRKRMSSLGPGDVEDTVLDTSATEAESDPSNLNLQLDVILQTPVIVLPRKPSSPEVLVAHLGKISIQNAIAHKAAETASCNESYLFMPIQPEQKVSEKLHVEIRDMSMYSMNLNQQKLGKSAMDFGKSMYASCFSMPQVGPNKSSYGKQILHNTVIEFTLEKIEPDENFINPGDTSLDTHFMGDISSGKFPQTRSKSQLDSVVKVDGRMVTEIKLELSKSVFEQILQTLDNLMPADDESVPPPRHADLPDISEEEAADGSSTKGSQTSVESEHKTSTSSQSSSSMGQLPHDADSKSDMSIQAKFEMPALNVRMVGDLEEFVDLRLQDFKVKFTKEDAYIKTLEVSLQSLLMEDLQCQQPNHRNLMVSYTSPKTSSSLSASDMKHAFLSHSCPTSMIEIPQPPMPSSLPTSFHRENVFESRAPATTATTVRPKVLLHKAKSTGGYPCTPPPSLMRTPDLGSRRTSTDATSDDMLVHITLKLVDKKCPEFVTKYKETHRFMNVDFNCLDTTINLQTWVMLLDFLGMGAKVHDLDQFKKSATDDTPQMRDSVHSQENEKEPQNTELKLKVHSLSLILNKSEYELARANISNVKADVTLRDGNFAVKGQLGSMSLQDQSPHGYLYRERFITTGSQVLDFDIFKYGTPDPDLQRENDMRIQIRMGRICYVHTQRFLQEIIAFGQHFNQLQDLLGRSRAASAGQVISERAFRGSRITLDVKAGAPILLFPRSSRSYDIMVMDLGTLNVSNTFLFAGDEGTLASRERSASQLSSAPSTTSTTTCLIDETLETADITFASAMSGRSWDDLTMSQMSGVPSSASGSSDLMTSSIYGSLYEDLRDSHDPTLDQSTVSRHATSDDARSMPSVTSHKDKSKPAGVRGTSSHHRTTSEPPRMFQSASDVNVRSTQSATSMSGLHKQASDPVATSSPEPETHKCLVDILQVELLDMDLFSAQWTSTDDYEQKNTRGDRDLVFPSFVVVQQGGALLQSKCRLDLQVERNLEGDLSHAVPDLRVQGALSSVHASLDIDQYRLVRGLLEHNLGEPLEEFQRPMLSHLPEPSIQTVLSGEVWKGISICLELNNFAVELLHSHPEGDEPANSLARFDFNNSRLMFETYSDQSKDIDLVSHEIVAHDTRFRDAPANARPNVFTNILQASRDSFCPDALQMELHYRSTRECTRFTVLLNNMRLMGIFDWMYAVKDFLGASAENPWKIAAEEKSVAEEEATALQQPASSSTYTVAGGIVTKRTISTEKVEPPFELKLNVMNTELVVVENAAMKDTNAVILKTTAVMNFRPSNPECILSVSLQTLEVFSCSLADEDNTALSIIDPMTVTLELSSTTLPHHRSQSTGLLDAYKDENRPPVMEISFSTLNIRLSYNDLKLFLAIFNSLPQQAENARSQSAPPRNAQSNTGLTSPPSSQTLAPDVDSLAVDINGSAAVTPVIQDKPGKTDFNISAFQVKGGCICFCLIDDCQDADVPIAEFTFSNIHLLQRWEQHREGWASLKMSGDYYNRSLSGWEPFLEAWGCHLRWNMGEEGDNKIAISVKATEMLGVNVTRVFLDQLRTTQKKWTDDYYGSANSAESDDQSGHRRRSPFVPFALRNDTGCKLHFRTDTSSHTKLNLSGSMTSLSESRLSGSFDDDRDWRLVMPGDEVQFMFEEQEKTRHKNTHELKVHQIRVKVDGWRGENLVSVDKVGVYFREAEPARSNSASMFAVKEPNARIVFDVTLEGSARKLVTVRSALMIDNQLEDAVLIKVDDVVKDLKGKSPTLQIESKSQLAVPLPLVLSRLWVKPNAYAVDYCSKAIHWQHVMKKGETRNGTHTCDALFGDPDSYKFCVSVFRQHFPEDAGVMTGQASEFPKPGHMITLMPPIRIVNLLPVDMSYYFKGLNLRSVIKPGKTVAVMGADLQHDLEVGVLIDNFPSCSEVLIPMGTPEFDTSIELKDSKNRVLYLHLNVREGIAGSVKLSISAPYWLMNKCGLPIVFRQETLKQEAAGQFEDHEVGQSFTPLLFSYGDLDASKTCSMRVGREVRSHGPHAAPIWSPVFSLERGNGYLPLHVRPSENRPDWVYTIGIEIRPGRGRYDKTHIVTLSPRYHLDNRSHHKLTFAQKYFARDDIGSADNHLTVPPRGKVPFHWPRHDLDPLLCVRVMDMEPGCLWSGGFCIDKVSSFHIIMRVPGRQSQFLRVDIILQSATYFIVFTDADHMPPPYRIDNFSEVPILYYQTKVTDDRLKTFIKPNSSVPYAFDEPILAPHITLSVQSGTKSTYNMDCIAEGEQITYENFIYIAFTATFKNSGQTPRGGARPARGYDNFVESQELVLDIIHGNKVVLKKKEQGKRSQFWRMTLSGMLQHEGSSAPRDPSQRASKATGPQYVLDIADIALRPGQDMPLTLRKPDERRKSTQTWRFTPDGRLCCNSDTLCVQAKNGFFGLQDGGEAVLGPSPMMSRPQDVPMEMAIQKEKVRPGSGALSVRVITDGPTRVLQIRDISQLSQAKSRGGSPTDDWVIVGRSPPSSKPGSPDKKKQLDAAGKKHTQWEVTLLLLKGIGLSIINHVPEELVFISFQHINIKTIHNGTSLKLEASINNIQVDNQLFGALVPVVLYVNSSRRQSPVSPTGSEPVTVPALHISIDKMVGTSKWNADIYNHCLINIRKFTLVVEELLLWKLYQFLGVNQADSELEQLDENSFKSQRALQEALAEQFQLKRYYFGRFELNTSCITLSMITAAELPSDLKVIKKAGGMPLVRFEDANVELDPFVKFHLFETSQFLRDSISLHYTEELKSQAAKILVSFDFLGNPLGLFNDFTEGLSGLIKDGNVGGLIKNVAHGVSNSTAKVTGSLSDGLSRLVDNEHEKARRDIITQRSMSGRSHIAAGVRGFAHGLYGGLSGVFTQPIKHVSRDGIEGFIPGVASGVVGLVTKPVTGVLDMASSTASAIRDKSRRSSHQAPPRIHRTRCCHGPGGLLPIYSEEHAMAQQTLHSLNNNKYTEMYVSIEHLRCGNADNLRLLISSEKVYFLGRSDPEHFNIVLQASYDELYDCTYLQEDGKFYIELCLKVDAKERGISGTPGRKRPRVRCDCETIARKVAQQILYAKNLYDEIRQTLPPDGVRVADD